MSASALQNHDAIGEDQDVSEKMDYCPGCGIKVQNESKDRPGYYQMPTTKKRDPRIVLEAETVDLTAEGDVERVLSLEPVKKPHVFCASVTMEIVGNSESNVKRKKQTISIVEPC